MKQYAFEREHAAMWARYEALLDGFSGKTPDRAQRYELPELYRRICQHYAIARQRQYSLRLVNALHRRVLAGHQRLYQHKAWRLGPVVAFVRADFPVRVRRHWRAFWLAALLFYGPALAFGLACYLDGGLIYQLMEARSVAELEYMYSPANDRLGRAAARESDTDFKMFGYYIFNNISIGFRTYAMGILAGLGTLYILIYNGLVIGGVAGHLSQLGFTGTFWPFVAGHSAFELTAICICGAAGLCLARPLIAPGQRRRLDAMKVAARASIRMAMGAALLLLIAAFIEAFWSPSRLVPATLKYTVGAFFWVALAAYLGLAGRGYNSGDTDSGAADAD